VSPKTADPSVRSALLETAAQIVAIEGRASLTIRRLAKEVGTSTMAVYTHFGNMEELRREVRREGFERLRSRLDSVRPTKDPVADLTLLGAAYYISATASPNLYRAMFLDGPVDGEDLPTGLDTFMYLVNCIARCVAAGRFPDAPSDDPAELAVDLWALTHGLVSLQLANLLGADEAVAHLESGGRSLFVAWGEDEAALRAAGLRAQQRFSELESV
jgi:AcrR family transcriptional regulator